MKLGIKAASIAAALAFCSDLSATAALAADAPTACPSGNVSIVRISKVTATGSMAGLNKAVADHAKWYADHGFSGDQIIAAPVLTYDKASNALVKSPDQVMTFHNHATSVPKEKHDAAWDAYVAEYKANSEISSETLVCMP